MLSRLQKGNFEKKKKKKINPLFPSVINNPRTENNSKPFTSNQHYTLQKKLPYTECVVWLSHEGGGLLQCSIQNWCNVSACYSFFMHMLLFQKSVSLQTQYERLLAVGSGRLV